LAALIEEARRRQRRRRRLGGPLLIVVACASGAIAFALVSREGGHATSHGPQAGSSLFVSSTALVVPASGGPVWICSPDGVMAVRAGHGTAVIVRPSKCPR
jgi:hypothetical protein